MLFPITLASVLAQNRVSVLGPLSYKGGEGWDVKRKQNWEDQQQQHACQQASRKDPEEVAVRTTDRQGDDDVDDVT